MILCSPARPADWEYSTATPSSPNWLKSIEFLFPPTISHKMSAWMRMADLVLECGSCNYNFYFSLQPTWIIFPNAAKTFVFSFPSAPPMQTDAPKRFTVAILT